MEDFVSLNINQKALSRKINRLYADNYAAMCRKIKKLCVKESGFCVPKIKDVTKRGNIKRGFAKTKGVCRKSNAACSRLTVVSPIRDRDVTKSSVFKYFKISRIRHDSVWHILV